MFSMAEAFALRLELIVVDHEYFCCAIFTTEKNLLVKQYIHKYNWKTVHKLGKTQSRKNKIIL